MSFGRFGALPGGPGHENAVRVFLAAFWCYAGVSKGQTTLSCHSSLASALATIESDLPKAGWSLAEPRDRRRRGPRYGMSYSIYIWQQAIWMLWPAILGKVWFLWLPVAFGDAWVSYKFLEQPFFSLRTRFRNSV